MGFQGYQFDYQYRVPHGKLMKVHCITVFKSYEEAEKACCDRCSEMEERGYREVSGEVKELVE